LWGNYFFVPEWHKVLWRKEAFLGQNCGRAGRVSVTKVLSRTKLFPKPRIFIHNINFLEKEECSPCQWLWSFHRHQMSFKIGSIKFPKILNDKLASPNIFDRLPI
jgi:hypothetical protein